MKEADIKPTIAQIDAELVRINKERDALTEEARILTARRADLEALAKITEMPPSKLRSQVIQAAGIESAEAVMTDNKR